MAKKKQKRELGRDVKIFIAISLLGALLGAGITIAVKLPKQIEAKKNMEDLKEKQKQQGLVIDLTDLKIPKEFQEIWKDKWYPYRPQMKQWTKEQAAKFQIDIKQVGKDILSKENDKLIQEMFGNVP